MSQPNLQTVARAMELLLCWNEDAPEDGFTLTELSQRLGLHKTIVHRLLATMASYDFVARDPLTNRYRLGVAVLALGGMAAAGMELRRLALPVMRNLVATTGETVMLSVVSGTDSVCIEKVESKNPIKVSYHVGRRRPLHAGAAAKVLLAFLPPSEAAPLMDRMALTRYTDLTLTSREELKAELEATRTRGYALSYGELDAGVTGIGAPVWDHTNRAVAGLTLVAPGHRLEEPETLAACTRATLETANQISRLLGYRS